MNLFLVIIYLIIGAKFLYPFFVRYIGLPELPPFTVQLLIMFLFITVYLTKYLNKKIFIISNNNFKPYKYSFVLLLVIIMTSTLVNANNVLLVLKSFFEFDIIFILLFLSIIELGFNENIQNYLIKFIYVIIILQIPVTIFQYFILGYSDADSISGTIASTNVGGTGVIAVFMTFLLAFTIEFILIKGFTFFRILLAASTTFPVIAGGARIALILFPITIITSILGFYIFRQNKRQVSFVKGILLAAFLFTIGLVAFIKIAPQTKFSRFFDLETISSVNKAENYDNSNDYKDSRIQGYYRLFDEVFKNDINILLGKGNEAITSSSSAGVKNIQLDFLFNRPDAMIFLASTGVLGLGLIILIIFFSIPILTNYIYHEVSEFMMVVAYSFIPITFNVIASLFYTTAWSSHIGLIFWVLLAVSFQRVYVLKSSAVLTNVLFITQNKILPEY